VSFLRYVYSGMMGVLYLYLEQVCMPQDLLAYGGHVHNNHWTEVHPGMVHCAYSSVVCCQIGPYTLPCGPFSSEIQWPSPTGWNNHKM